MTSVVIPVYQGADVLPTTIPAVLALRGVDEIIWVDDGSTDGTGALLDRACASRPDATVLTLPQNAGRSRARNAGVEASTGDVIVFFDADVEPGPDSARLLAVAASSAGAVAAVARLDPVCDDPEEPYQDYVLHHPRGPRSGYRSREPLPWKYFLSGVCAVRRTGFEVAGRFPERVEYGEDVAFACQLADDAPDGLRLAATTVRLHDIGDLERALRNAARFGEASAEIARSCESGPAGTWGKLQVLGRLAGFVHPILQSVIAMCPSSRIRRSGVRYLLGATVLSASRRA